MINPRHFPYKELIRAGWIHTKEHWSFFIGLMFIYHVTSYLTSDISARAWEDGHMGLSIILHIATFLLSAIMSIGMIKIVLRIIDKNKEGKVSELFIYTSYLSKYIIASLMYAGIILVGLLLFIVPGIIWAVRYQFVFYLIIDKHLLPGDALRKSKEITTGLIGKIFLFNLLTLGINALGLITLVGILITSPITMIAYAHLYRKLIDKNDQSKESIPTEEKLKEEAKRAATDADALKHPQNPIIRKN
jgi:uncharacterized membrane protein